MSYLSGTEDIQRAYDELFVEIYGNENFGLDVTHIKVDFERYQYAMDKIKQRYQLYRGNPQLLLWVLKCSELPLLQVTREFYLKEEMNMNFLETLKNLAHIAVEGDEDGIKPDLNQGEINALKWAVEELEKIIK